MSQLSPQPSQEHVPALETKDLSVTALYTAQNWVWGGFDNAKLFESEQSKAVFGATNLALALFGVFHWGRPSLHKGLVQRHALIDQRVKHLQPSQVVELAAGLSARGLRMTSDSILPNLTQYLEIDLPHVIEHKKLLLNRFRQDPDFPAQLEWRGLDVTQISLRSLFQDRPQGSGSRLIIAEGLFMYLDESAQRALWQEAYQALQDGGVLLFDLVPTSEQAPPGLLGRLLGALMARFTGGSTFTVDQRGREDICYELSEIGFKNIKLYDTQRFAQEFGLPFPQTKTQQLIFEAHAP